MPQIQRSHFKKINFSANTILILAIVGNFRPLSIEIDLMARYKVRSSTLEVGAI